MLQYLNDPNPPSGLVTPKVDGFAYYGDFFDRIEDLSAGDRVYIMNWHIAPFFAQRGDLDTTTEESDLLRTKLVDLIDEGVDVRILVWMNTNFFRPEYDVRTLADRVLGRPGADLTILLLRRRYGDDIVDRALASNRLQELVARYNGWSQQYSTAFMVRDWRQQPGMASRIAVNTLDAPTGGCHAKFVLVLERDGDDYTGVGYTGGLDFGDGRYGDKFHQHKHDGWHDVQAKVEGPEILEHLTDFYVQIWNENIARRDAELATSMAHRSTIRIGAGLFNYDDGAPIEEFSFPCVPDAATPIGRSGITMKAESGPWPHKVLSLRTLPDVYPLLGEPELSFAPDGAFEFRDALRHAIEQAEHYIYIEDQGMESLEIFGWLRQAIATKPNLRVIVLTGARDPADPPTRHIARTLLAWWFLNRLSDDDQKRFHFLAVTPYIVHSKVYLIDDAVAIIGSAGMFTRSLSQEIEHAVIFGSDAGDTAVADLRTELWSELIGVGRNEFDDAFTTMADAIGVFDRSTVGDTADATAHALPCHARHKDQSSLLLDNQYLAALDPAGFPVFRELSEDELDDLLAWAGQPKGDVTILATQSVSTRKFDWSPTRFVAALVEAEGEQWIVGPAVQTPPDPLPDPGAPVIQADSITDARLSTISGLMLGEFMPFRLIGNLAEANALIRVTGGSQSGQMRRILTHVGNTITFEPLVNPPDAGFDYDLRIPAVHEIDLDDYEDASAYEGEAQELLFDLTKHMLTNEIPFHTLFNPSQVLANPTRLTSWSVPLPVTARVAVNQIITLVVVAPPTETVTWECDEPDVNQSSESGYSFAVQFSMPGTKIVRAIHAVSPGPPIVYTYEIRVVENSGAQWVAQFEPSRDLADLAEPFQGRARAFLDALDAAQVTYVLKSTRRPKQRAFLMAWAYRIAGEERDPRTIDDVLDDVPISWVHYAANGTPDLAASKAAADAMVLAYDIGSTGASEKSHHITGNAIDVKVTLGNIEVAKADGHKIVIDTEDKLTMVGRSYKIRRYKQSNHWSMNGH